MKRQPRIINSLRRHDRQERIIQSRCATITATWNEKDDTAEIAILDTIGKDPWEEGGYTEKDFRNALADIPKSKNLHVLINSRGGDVFEGFGIKNAIAEWPNKVTASITGVAASTASWMILDADEIRAPRASQMFVHDAMAIGVGNAEDMRQLADKLDKTSDQIAGFYAAKNGKSVKEMRKMMRNDTLMTGAEAKEMGLVDVLTDEKPVRNFLEDELAGMRNRLASFKNSAPTQGADQTKNQPPQNIMNKQEMIALLNKWGVTIPDNATDQQLKDLVAAGKPAAPATPPPAPAPATPAPMNLDADRLAKLEKKLEAQRIENLTRQFNEICATRPGVDREDWLPKVLADDTDATLNLLRKFPETPEPLNIGGNRIISMGNPVIEAFNKLQPGLGRREFLRENYDGLRNAMRSFNPKNINTIDSALVTHFLADGLVVVAQNRLAMLNLFSRDFGVDALKPRATVQVRKALTAATGQQNATNFESGDSVLDNIAVTVNQESLSFHVSNSDLNSGTRLEHLSEINSEAFANQISDLVTAIMTVANYGAALVVGQAANFDPDDLSPILAVAKNYRQKNLALDGGHLAYITPKLTTEVDYRNNGSFGFDKIAEQNRWTNAAANAVGFVCGPDAIGVASGMSVDLPAGEFLSLQTVTLKNGLTVRIAVWFSRAGRVMWAAYDVMFGAAAGDTTQGEVLVTA